MTASVRWWWIRHAPVETDGRYPLPEAAPDMAGAAAALDALAAVLPRKALWLTSPLARARITAEALIARVEDGGAAPAVLDGLSEQDFGAWAGRAYDAVYAETGPGPWRAPDALRPPGGESFADLVRRLGRTLDGFDPAALAGGEAPRDVIAVAHAGSIRAALAHTLGLAPAAALRFSIDPLSLTRIDRLAGGGGWRVAAVNRAVEGGAGARIGGIET